MNVNIRIEELIRSTRSHYKQYLVASLHDLIHQCRELEIKTPGAGVELLNELCKSYMDPKTFQAVKRAIESPEEKYRIVLIQ